MILALDWHLCLPQSGSEAEPYQVPIFHNGSPQTSSNSRRLTYSRFQNQNPTRTPLT
jgi:hypothetical protein